MLRESAAKRRTFLVLIKILLIVATVGGFSADAAFAQAVGGNIGGEVTDQTGARLPGATITITNQARGSVQVIITGPEGTYRAVALQPAQYEITAELAGFSTAKRSLTVNVGADLTVDFRLGVSTVQETVTVTGSTPLVEVAKSQPTSVVDAEQITALPVLSRSFLELAQLLPGAGMQNGPQSFLTTRFGGAADQRNSFTTVIDGGTINDSIWGATISNVTQDAVQEFTVFRNQFDAQYGQALNTVVSVATKSGTNELHGSGFYFGRDRALNALNYFEKEKPPFSQQRYGGTVGGPIALNKTHFFGSYEYNDLSTAKVIALAANNPFAAEQNGVFPTGMTDRMGAAKIDHRFSNSQSFFVRYLYDNQYILREGTPSSDERQTDERNITHSIVAEQDSILSQAVVNTLRFHYLKQYLELLGHSDKMSISRPSVSTGSATNAPQYFPRWDATLSEVLFVNRSRHAFKFGGDARFFSGVHDSHWNERGSASFGTNAPFDPNIPSTWPFAFEIQKPAVWRYSTTQFTGFAQDDWRLQDRVRLNLGLRYDLDTNLRHNDFYYGLLDDPRYAGIDHFISKNRGNEYDAFQPRLGVTWDVKGTGSVVLRGGFGKYVTRNREWFNMTTQDRSRGLVVRIENPALLRFFPDVNAMLGGKSLEAYLAAGGARPLVLLADDFSLPYSLNATGGVGWEINSKTSLTVDYVHDYGAKQIGAFDRNLPASGPISASNPRPVAQFTEVKMIENYTKSWYDALETQLKMRVSNRDTLQVSYTLSRIYRDGVNHYQNYMGTMRTPQDKGYSENDQRHNLSLAETLKLPWQLNISGVFKWISGSPMVVQAGSDLDGDGQSQSDRPPGLPITVGRGDVDAQLQVINSFRASRGLPATSSDLLKLNPYLALDLRLTRAVNLKRDGKQRFELFAEAYNLTNHVNFQSFSVSGNLLSPDFLTQRAARYGRQMQWGVRYVF